MDRVDEAIRRDSFCIPGPAVGLVHGGSDLGAGPCNPQFVAGTPEVVAYVVNRMHAGCALDYLVCSGSSTREEFVVGRIAAPGPKWAILLGDEHVAVGGLSESLPGVHTAWLAATIGILNVNPSYLRRCCRTVIDSMFGYPDVRRIQAYVRSNWEEANRFALVCGLKLEGELVGYCKDGSSVKMYGIARGKT